MNPKTLNEDQEFSNIMKSIMLGTSGYHLFFGKNYHGQYMTEITIRPFAIAIRNVWAVLVITNPARIGRTINAFYCQWGCFQFWRW